MSRHVFLLALAGCWTANPPPPAEPPPPKARVVREVVQPVEIEKVEEDPCGGDPCGVPGGVYGGTIGGTVGGVPGGIAPPPPPPPPPSGAPQTIPPTLLEPNRIAGIKAIAPADIVKVQIARSGKEKLIGSWKLCIDTSGAVASVTLLRSTGFPDYDRAIDTEIRTGWKYRPYLINGAPANVCTAVTFIYSQPQPQPQPSPPPRP